MLGCLSRGSYLALIFTQIPIHLNKKNGARLVQTPITGVFGAFSKKNFTDKKEDIIFESYREDWFDELELTTVGIKTIKVFSAAGP